MAAFDAFLRIRALRLDGIVIGGAALGLLGVVSRQTQDCDILDPELPEAIKDAARAFAAEQRGQGHILADDWLNNGPSALREVLPPGWRDRLQIVYRGAAITLRTLGRLDLLRSKLFALCDRGIDLPDCLALAPSPGELSAIHAWLAQQDANPDWPRHVRATLRDLQERLADHGI